MMRLIDNCEGFLGACTLLLVACGNFDISDIGSGSGSAGHAGTSGSTTSGGAGGGSTAGAEQLCVDTINQYRATLQLPPYERWTGAELCADGESESDSVTMTAHGAFPQCGERAQNECPGWPPPADTMIVGCLQKMWEEGPGDFNNGHGHYINMSSKDYSFVACGFYTTPSGDIWSVQDFK